MSKRFDIQALRALAVIAVLVFHSGYLLNAGYLGVDVFFVVSGFVVTQLILRRIQAEGKLDLSEFWKKRVRRLFPGLALMVVVLTPVSLLVFPRLEEASAGLITAAAGVFSTANIAAALLEFDYFAAPSKENFMLHLWSLSVEEQFYVLWPLAFVALWGSLKIKKFAIVVALIALTSVLVWIIGSTELLGLLDRGQAFFGFFSPISRAWEFLAGALVALLPEANSRTHWSNPMSKVGWAVVLAILIFAPSEPPALNLAVLILVLGVCAILRWGSTSDIESILRGPRLRWIQFIGDRSYSLYLWHWPLAVFGSILLPEREFAALLGILISVPLSFLAFALVEQPFRFRNGIGRHKLKTAVPVLLLSTAVTLGFTALSFERVEQTVSEDALPGGLNEEEFFAEMDRISVECSFAFSCFQTVAEEEVDILILGNSHGAHLTVGLAQAFPSKNIVWVRDSSVINGNVTIPEILDEIPDPVSVIISEYLSAPGSEGRAVDWEFAFALLTEAGAEVVVTNGSPTLDVPAYKCKFGLAWNPRQHRCSFAADSNNLRQAIYSARLEAAVAGFAGVQVADIYSEFCDGKYCTIGDSSGIFFRDLNHFTPLGSSMAAEAIKARLQN